MSLMRCATVLVLPWLLTGCYTRLGQVRQLGPVEWRAVAYAWSADNQLLASAHADGAVRVWDVTSGRELARTSGFRSYQLIVDTAGLAFSPDAKWVAYAGHDAAIHIWDWAAGTTRRIPLQSQVRTITFKPSGSEIVAATGGMMYPPQPTTRPSSGVLGPTPIILRARVITVDVNSGRIVSAIAADGMLNTVLSRDGERFGGTVVPFSPETIWPVRMPDPQLENAGGFVRVRETSSGKLLLERSPVLGWWTEFSPDGMRIRSGTVVWDIRSGKQIYSGDINVGRFTSDARILVSRQGVKGVGLMASIRWTELSELDLDTGRRRRIGKFLGEGTGALTMPPEAWSWDRRLVVDPQLRIWRLPL